MLISTKGRYAVRALLEIALSSEQGTKPVSSSSIAQRQNISKLYLEQLFVRLKSGGLVRSVRGPGGGFALAKAPSDISIQNIIHLMEGRTMVAECLDDESLCERSKLCATRKIWKKVKTAVDDVLSGISLAELVKIETGEVKNETLLL